jgi:hypothetical protein
LKSKDLYFESVEDFAADIVERIERDEDLFLTVVGKFEKIKNIIKEIFVITEVDFESLNIKSPVMDGYNDEYVLDCWCDDGIIQIGCEPAKRNGEYLNLAGDETYLLEDCSSKIIPSCEGSDLYFVNLDEDCDCDEECCDVECCCDCHKDDGGDYTIKVICDLGTDEAMDIINKLESGILKANKAFKTMNNMMDLFRF